MKFHAEYVVITVLENIMVFTLVMDVLVSSSAQLEKIGNMFVR